MLPLPGSIHRASEHSPLPRGASQRARAGRGSWGGAHLYWPAGLLSARHTGWADTTAGAFLLLPPHIRTSGPCVSSLRSTAQTLPGKRSLLVTQRSPLMRNKPVTFTSAVLRIWHLLLLGGALFPTFIGVVSTSR
ncbi:hypothetical protein NDU88_005144 [Pleurodeles waltl]|uniref:Uncharacterized protein n=1 Tax=Pleurodeles waltl TaxID=8319 RepID=A0AAV7LWL3_PLEWA|nr:hypothetical protein NDU88_005144 [Pleurodeles waltl]